MRKNKIPYAQWSGEKLYSESPMMAQVYKQQLPTGSQSPLQPRSWLSLGGKRAAHRWCTANPRPLPNPRLICLQILYVLDRQSLCMYSFTLP